MHNEIIVKFIPADHWWERSTWELMETYTSHNGRVEVPRGFITDGTSVPWFARILFSATGKEFGASIVHDYILVTEHNWSKANTQMAAELEALDVSEWRQNLVIAGVTLYSLFLKLIGHA